MANPGSGVPKDSAKFAESATIAVSTSEPEAVPFASGNLTGIPMVEEIEKYVYSIGTDDVQVFGGDKIGGGYIQQIPEEIAPCVHAMLSSSEHIDSYLEIGSAAGGMTLLMHNYFAPAVITLVDTNEHPRCVNRPQVLAGIKRDEVIGDSNSEETAAKVNALGYVYDAIMIDGVHYYANVKKDYDLYAPLIRDGGFLMLHDSVRTAWGVPRLVAELKEYPAWQFIGEWASKKMTPCGVALFQRVT